MEFWCQDFCVTSNFEFDEEAAPHRTAPPDEATDSPDEAALPVSRNFVLSIIMLKTVKCKR